MAQATEKPPPTDIPKSGRVERSQSHTSRLNSPRRGRNKSAQGNALEIFFPEEEHADPLLRSVTACHPYDGSGNRDDEDESYAKFRLSTKCRIGGGESGVRMC
jgi:hypothetical protein